MPEESPQISYVRADSLVGYARNSKQHSSEQIAKLMASIVEFGWTFPVLADEKGIVAGHGRVSAALKLYEAGKTIKLPSGKEIPAGTVPVIDCSGWPDTKRRAYIIADNKLPEATGSWDDEMLASEMAGLMDDGFNVGLLGFTDAELAVWGGGEEDKKPGGDGIAYKEKYAVLVECAGEHEQQLAYDNLQSLGYVCKVLVN